MALGYASFLLLGCGGQYSFKEESMDKAVELVVRKVGNIPRGQPITLLKFLGFSSCPLASEEGITNCPLGFGERRKPPAEPQCWMRASCEDDTWRERWKQILEVCHKCQGKPQPRPEETQPYSESFGLLMGGEK